jgi:hypothetical protein
VLKSLFQRSENLDQERDNVSSLGPPTRFSIAVRVVLNPFYLSILKLLLTLSLQESKNTLIADEFNVLINVFLGHDSQIRIETIDYNTLPQLQ